MPTTLAETGRPFQQKVPTGGAERQRSAVRRTAVTALGHGKSTQQNQRQPNPFHPKGSSFFPDFRGVSHENPRISGGKLKDLAGNGAVTLEAPITQFPNFEQLEAAGQNQLPPEIQKLFTLIERVSAKPSEGLGLY